MYLKGEHSGHLNPIFTGMDNISMRKNKSIAELMNFFYYINEYCEAMYKTKEQYFQNAINNCTYLLDIKDHIANSLVPK